MDSYRASGKMGSLALPAAIGLGLLAAVAGAYVYQFLIDLIPFIYLNFFVTLGFGALIGLAVGFAFVIFHGRKPRLAIGLAVALAVVGCLASFHFAHQGFIEDVKEEMRDSEVPEEMLDVGIQEIGLDKIQGYLDLRVEAGWTFGSSEDGPAISGFMVYLIWLIELVMIGGAAVYMAGTMTCDPYCEACEVWTDEADLGGITNVDRSEALGAAKAGGSVEDLFELSTSDDDVAHVTFSVHSCHGETCPLWLTAQVMWHEYKKGKAEEKTETVFSHRRITSAELNQLVAAIEAQSA